MKITKEHFDHMKTECERIRAANPNIAKTYSDAGLSNMRMNWDIARGAGLIPFFCNNIYSYANDTHINTALAKIMGNDGTDSKGKKR